MRGRGTVYLTVPRRAMWCRALQEGAIPELDRNPGDCRLRPRTHQRPHTRETTNAGVAPTRLAGRFAWLCALALLAALPLASRAQTDVSGARDPDGIPRFPRSWVVSFEAQEHLAPREFIVSAVEKIRRELRIDEKLRVDATALRVTYQVPAGTPRDDVVGHYRRALGTDALFSCEGFDCGRSNAWASQVYGQAILYGPDRNQFYIAADRDGQLVSAYVIERGNRRIYAHIEVLQPEHAVSATGNAKLTERLAGDGFAEVVGVRPRRDGTIPAEGVDVLRNVAPQLRIFERQTLYVVCHLYGPEAGAHLLERAGNCARVAADELGEALAADDAPVLIPFAAGPLLPRAGGAASRIELVLPHRQQRD